MGPGRKFYHQHRSAGGKLKGIVISRPNRPVIKTSGKNQPMPSGAIALHSHPNLFSDRWQSYFRKTRPTTPKRSREPVQEFSHKSTRGDFLSTGKIPQKLRAQPEFDSPAELGREKNHPLAGFCRAKPGNGIHGKISGLSKMSRLGARQLRTE